MVRDDSEREVRIDLYLASLTVALNEVFKLRSELNEGRRMPASELIPKYSPEILVAIVRRYFMELPTPLITSDLYETFKILYLSSRFLATSA
jgi:hypothetical protein